MKLNDHAMDALRYMVMALDHQNGGRFRSAAAIPERRARWD